MLKIKSLLLVCVAWLFPLSPALACVSNVLDISVHRLVELAASVVITLLLLFLTWAVKRLFFKDAEQLSVPLVFALLCSLAFGLVGYFVVPAFEPVFASFGAELPALTQWLIDFRPVFFLPTLLVFTLGYFFRKCPKNPRFPTLFVLCALNAFLFCWVLFALYSPIFKLGCIE